MEIETAEALDPNEQSLADEIGGTIHRVEHFYLPLFEEFCRERHRERGGVQILDLGCGNAVSVELLREAGFRAFGTDHFPERYQFRREHSDVPNPFFFLGDALRLAVDDNVFDIVFSSGVLEHIGVNERWLPWVLTPMSVEDQRAERVQFFRECFRILKPDGILYVDHPNGACPVDFWHHDRPGKPRPHSTKERFNPRLREVRSIVAAVDPAARIEPLSPANRFSFGRSKRRWYRAFLGPMEWWFGVMKTPAFAWARGTALNPYLIERITRSPAASAARN